MVSSLSEQPGQSSPSAVQNVPSYVESSHEKNADTQTITGNDNEVKGTKDDEGKEMMTEKDVLALQEEEDEWEHDPANPRLWSSRKKWRMTAIVSFVFLHTPQVD